MVLKKYTDCSP